VTVGVFPASVQRNCTDSAPLDCSAAVRILVRQEPEEEEEEEEEDDHDDGEEGNDEDDSEDGYSV
jgi:hypothetical protein